MLVNASGLLYALKVCRICKIDGRLGGGKTSLAFRLAYEIVNKGFANYITANVSNVWNVYPDEWKLDKNQKLNAVIILDEAGKFIKGRAEASQYLDALRKINCILIAPSHEEAPPNFGEITIEYQRQWDVIGLPIWIYKWWVKGDIKNAQKFYWIKPSEIFGVYSTGEYTISSNGIKESLQNIVQEIKQEEVRIYGKKGNNISIPKTQLPEYTNESERKIEELEEAIWRIENQLQEQVKESESISVSPRRLWKKST